MYSALWLAVKEQLWQRTSEEICLLIQKISYSSAQLHTTTCCLQVGPGIINPKYYLGLIYVYGEDLCMPCEKFGSFKSKSTVYTKQGF